MWHTSVIHLREKSFGSIALFVSHFLNLRLFGSSVVYQVQGSNRFWLVQCKTNDTIDNWDLMMLNAVKIWIKNPFSGCHNDITLSRYSQYTYIERERTRGCRCKYTTLFILDYVCFESCHFLNTLSLSPSNSVYLILTRTHIHPHVTAKWTISNVHDVTVSEVFQFWLVWSSTVPLSDWI